MNKRKWLEPSKSRWWRVIALSLTWLMCVGMFTRAMAQGENRILDIRVEGTAQAPTVFIQTERRPSSSVFTLPDPMRVVVDIADAVPGSAGLNPQGKGPIRSVSVQEFRRPDGVISRVSLGLSQPVDFTSEVRDDGVLVKLTARSGAVDSSLNSSDDPIGAELARMEAGEDVVEEVAPPPSKSGSSSRSAASQESRLPSAEIIGLDFMPYSERSRVRIKTSAPVEHEITSAPGGQVVILLKNASVNEKYRRPLDTSEFPSAVKLVSAYPSREENGVKVVVKLREQVTWTEESRDGALYVDFPVPEGMRAAAAAAPTGAGKGQIAMGPTTQGGSATITPSSTGQAPGTGALPATLIGASGQIAEPSAGGGSSAGSTFGEGGFGSAIGFGGPNPQRFTVDLREADLHNVFRIISSVAGVNIVAGDDVKGKITIRLVDVPWDEALSVICQTKGLGAIKAGNIIRIAPLSVIRNERETALEAARANKELEPLMTLVVPLNYANVKEVEKQLKSLLTERGKLTVDTRTNSAIVEDTAATLAKIQSLIGRLDTQTPEVMIEARIVEASSTFVREFGIQWGTRAQVGSNTGNPTGLFFPNSIIAGGGLEQTSGGVLLPSEVDTTPNWVLDLPASNGVGALNLALGSISDIINIDARLSAVEAMGHGKVVSSPRVTTLDNSTATIEQGTRIPYQTTSASGTTVQFIQASLVLQVTPHITADGQVSMQVAMSNNRPDFGNVVDGYPAIEVKEAQTTVLVGDGDTTVIGGVFTYSTSENVVGLPVLYKLPVIGALFRNKLIREERKELLVFITPHIVSKDVAPFQGTSAER